MTSTPETSLGLGWVVRGRQGEGAEVEVRVERAHRRDDVGAVHEDRRLPVGEEPVAVVVPEAGGVVIAVLGQGEQGVGDGRVRLLERGLVLGEPVEEALRHEVGREPG